MVAKLTVVVKHLAGPMFAPCYGERHPTLTAQAMTVPMTIRTHSMMASNRNYNHLCSNRSRLNSCPWRPSALDRPCAELSALRGCWLVLTTSCRYPPACTNPRFVLPGNLEERQLVLDLTDGPRAFNRACDVARTIVSLHWNEISGIAAPELAVA